MIIEARCRNIRIESAGMEVVALPRLVGRSFSRSRYRPLATASSIPCVTRQYIDTTCLTPCIMCKIELNGWLWLYHAIHESECHLSAVCDSMSPCLFAMTPTLTVVSNSSLEVVIILKVKFCEFLWYRSIFFLEFVTLHWVVTRYMMLMIFLRNLAFEDSITLCSTFLSGTSVESQTIVLGCERNSRAFGEKENVTRLSLHFVASLIRDSILT